MLQVVVFGQKFSLGKNLLESDSMLRYLEGQICYRSFGVWRSNNKIYNIFQII